MMSTAEPLLPSRRSHLLGIAGILLSHFVALWCVVIVLDKAVPVYRVLFEQYNVVPPARTEAIFAFADYCSAPLSAYSLWQWSLMPPSYLRLTLRSPRRDGS